MLKWNETCMSKRCKSKSWKQSWWLWYWVSNLSLRAATPGSSFPSKSSKEAPPPVLQWVTWKTRHSILTKTWRQRQQPQQPQQPQHVVKHNNFDQYYDACNNIPANSMCPVMLNYLPTYCRLVFGAILLAGCGSVTAWREKLPDGFHTEHHWTNLSRPNSNLVAPPITVTVPAPVASTTASISFFLSSAQLESTGSFEFMNLSTSV